ncbi:Protein of unknown function [Pyronema omphalodes CBS 100304]|uniref:Uncharacterized protein n=1 Tax=Pyronema omphalodes (strain CBS 100304) TaxID=1076935 RepID=U4LEZ4_PYROM|nr:Protein of unknown function [Pyronema omphalodes CBS 100304]
MIPTHTYFCTQVQGRLQTHKLFPQNGDGWGSKRHDGVVCPAIPPHVPSLCSYRNSVNPCQSLRNCKIYGS